MACFALVVARLYTHTATLWVFTLAALTWFVTATALFSIAWITGHSRDENPCPSWGPSSPGNRARPTDTGMSA